MTAWLHVAAGVIYDASGRILIARRLPESHQGGLWEFPGGKLEAGESAEVALRRELREELSIEVRQAQPLLQVRHLYADRAVLLDVWSVTRFLGIPQGMQGQETCWVAPDALPRFKFPAANWPIVAAARLPDRYAIVDGDAEPDELARRLDALAARGLRLAQWRAHKLPVETFRQRAPALIERARRLEMRLLLNCAPELARELEADGVHLSSRRLAELTQRPNGLAWVGASVHGAKELADAQQFGVDFAVLGPVQATASHPDAKPLGWEQFGALVADVNLPVFALGGLDETAVSIARQRGGQGIAAIRAFLN